MVKDMTSGSPMRLIFSFALPLLMGNLLQQTYSLVDAALVGQFLGMNALAGVGASSSVLFLILGFCNGLTGGFGIPVAQSVGAKRDDHVRDYVRHSYLLGGVISVFLAVVCSMLCSHILRWMQTPEEIFQEANIYLLVTFITIPINLYYNLISSIIRALGDSKTPFYFMLLSTILNIIFDLVFILLLRWGVAGAAIATALAQLICIDGCLRYMKRHFSILYNPDESFSLNLKRVHKLLMMGIPMGLQFSITAIGSIMLQSANNSLGTICATAFTAGMRIKMFCICPFENLGVAMATYCGQNLGAARRFAENAANYLVRIRRGVFCALEGMVVYAAFMILVLRLFSRQISTLFIYASETEILDCSEQFLCVSCVFYPVLGTLCILRYSLQGLGYTSLSMFSGFNEMIARVGVSLFVVPWLGFYGVCIGDPTAWIAAVMFLIPAFTIIYKRLYSFCVEKQPNRDYV